MATPGPGPEAQYRAFLQEGRFMIQRSASSGKHVFYPRVAAPVTGAADLEWVEASGLGTVYSITVNRSRAGNYNIALVELDEGPRLMTRIEGVETAAIGTRVKGRIADIDGELAMVFDVVAGGGAS
ncbi:MAG: OB-fold domain-containing protein [Alphaproteobacteria bacterium]|nr:OB-fold domain-containing protein [Alphaproteobacteria bacterium]MBU0797173.1 OB-fold domain-containing protein [Alphaproteobacteria bacterium]MBU0887156.1 OB-fold domain-containing protein [Alphaproteobacteria bacterium]MBU1814406.1 OB-fold domain-containing protein [Alphaproteobacteria bacterium]